MASIIRAGTTSGTALNVTADTSGNLALTADSGVIDASSTTGALNIPVGTTAQRPSTLVAGALRFNSTTSVVEVYTGSTIGWVTLANGAGYTVNYLSVAGGGGGSGANAGGAGGGAGGLLTGTTVLIPSTAYTVTIGAGGAGN
jgi:hypothetical protein